MHAALYFTYTQVIESSLHPPRAGYESATDCGGGCTACSVGSRCYVGQDCVSGICSNLGAGTPAACRAPSCLDRVPNGNEADVDCGTACCDVTVPLAQCSALCADGFKCASSLDCFSGRCLSNPTLGAKYCSGTKVSAIEPLLSSRLVGAINLAGTRKNLLSTILPALINALGFFLDVPPGHIKMETITDVFVSPPQWGVYAYSAIRANNSGISIDALSGQVTYGSSSSGGDSSSVVPPIIPTYWITTMDTVTGCNVRFSVYAYPGELELLMGRLSRLFDSEEGWAPAGGWGTWYSIMEEAAVAADEYAYCASFSNASDPASVALFSAPGGVDCSPFMSFSNATTRLPNGIAAADSLGATRLATLLPDYYGFLVSNASEAMAAGGNRRLQRQQQQQRQTGSFTAHSRSLRRYTRNNRRRLTVAIDAPSTLVLNETNSGVNFTWGLDAGSLGVTSFASVVAAALPVGSITGMFALENVSYDTGMDAPSFVPFPDHVAVLRQPRGTPSAPLWGGYRISIQPWVAMLDRHHRIVVGLDPTLLLTVTAALVIEDDPTGAVAASVTLTGATSARFGEDGIARFVDLGVSAWPNTTTNAVSIAFTTTVSASLTVSGATQLFVIQPVPEAVLMLYERKPMPVGEVAGIFFGCTLLIGVALYSVLTARRWLATPLKITEAVSAQPRPPPSSSFERGSTAAAAASGFDKLLFLPHHVVDPLEEDGGGDGGGGGSSTVYSTDKDDTRTGSKTESYTATTTATTATAVAAATGSDCTKISAMNPSGAAVTVSSVPIASLPGYGPSVVAALSHLELRIQERPSGGARPPPRSQSRWMRLVPTTLKVLPSAAVRDSGASGNDDSKASMRAGGRTGTAQTNVAGAWRHRCHYMLRACVNVRT